MLFPKLSTELTPIWERFHTAALKGQLPKALLLHGTEGHASEDLLPYLQAQLLCISEKAPCGACQSCQLVLKKEHPDLQAILPEKPGASIKIEAIREMQGVVYQSPQLQKHRVIYIHPLDDMTLGAANALLKILEEPPEPVYFIAFAREVSFMLPTLLSRFQRWRLPYRELKPDVSSYLAGLTELREGKISVCGLAERWAKQDLGQVLGALYTVIAGVAMTPDILRVLSYLETLLAQLRVVPAMNPTLTLESVLLHLSSSTD